MKFAMLAPHAAMTALTRGPIGPVRSNPKSRALLQALVEETVAVGVALKTGLEPTDVAKVMQGYDALPKGFLASMAHDIFAGKPIEVDHLSGVVVQPRQRSRRTHARRTSSSPRHSPPSATGKPQVLILRWGPDDGQQSDWAYSSGTWGTATERAHLMALTMDEEIERYKRHLVLREVGGQGQQKIKAARVLVIGAGGLGSPVLMYLAAAGVGTHRHHRRRSRLARQPAAPDRARHAARRRPKVESASETIAKLNPHVRVETYDKRIDAGNALEIISRYDIVADGSDNFATRYLVSDACYLAKKTLVFAASARSTAISPPSSRTRRAPTASPIPAIAASSPKRRRRAPSPTAPRSACSARPSAWSARCRPPRCSRRSSASARALRAGCCSTMRRPRVSTRSSSPGTRPIRSRADADHPRSFHPCRRRKRAQSACRLKRRSGGGERHGDPRHPVRQGRHAHRLLAHLGADQSRCGALCRRRRSGPGRRAAARSAAMTPSPIASRRVRPWPPATSTTSPSAFAAHPGVAHAARLAAGIERIFCAGGAMHSALIARRTRDAGRVEAARLSPRLATNDSVGGLRGVAAPARYSRPFRLCRRLRFRLRRQARPGHGPRLLRGCRHCTRSEAAMVGDAVHDLAMGRAAGLASISACCRAPAAARISKTSPT